MTLDQLTFDSRKQTKGDGFDAYHALYCGGTDVSRADGDFMAAVTARRFPRLLVFERELAGVGHERTRRRVAGDGFDHALIQLVLSGRLAVETGDERRWIEAGEMVAFDMRRPQRTWTDGACYLTVSIPRQFFRARTSAAKPFHGRVLTGEAVPVARERIRGLAGSGLAPDSTMAEAVTASLGSMLGALLGSGCAASRAAAAAEVNGRRAMRFIRENLGRADLSAELIADRIGVSRSVLYRIFEVEGGVARSIKQQRLLAMRRALARPSERRAISSLARSCGFISDAHASRSFREAFGATPGDYRTSRRFDDRDAANGRDFLHWYDDFS